ncbi:MAG: TIGR03663 family protein [Chloroflexi bacterium]|nr:TIGR03663 family protein [Chloroflexota bacterium]MXY00210.1 TIGR03663 family protein [Chloroflexota bacterium]MYB17138.1 TIGR03663 family protein [Chloroflexota bacterium]
MIGYPTVLTAVRRIWMPASIAAAAALTRLAALGDRAFHHDESIHAVTALERLESFVYLYDPLYHGPFLYYANALVFLVAGASDFTARLLPALAGIALLLAVPWLLRDYLGRWGTLLAVAILTLSPAFLYYSRFLRNDIYIALLTLVAMGSLLRYIEQPQRRWVLLAAGALGLGVATKENTYITGFIFVTFLAILGGALIVAGHRKRSGRTPAWAAPLAAAATRFISDRVGLVWGLVLLVGIPALLFSSFLLNTEGLLDSIRRSVAVWAQVHESERVNQPWFFYTGLVLLLEAPAAVLGVVGFVRALRSPDLFGTLLVWWVTLSFLIYSAAGEKAAWLVLHPLLPLCLLAARCGGDWIAGSVGKRRLLAAAVIVLLLAVSARNALATTFSYGDVPRTPLVYTQTSRDVLAILDIIEDAGQISGSGRELPILVDATAHWPLAWYLREHEGAVFGNGPDHVEPGRYAVMILDPATVAVTGFWPEQYAARYLHLREWFPERVYQNWRFADLGRIVTDPSGWRRFWRQWAFHEPPVPIGSTDVYVFIARTVAGPSPAAAPVATHG